MKRWTLKRDSKRLMRGKKRSIRCTTSWKWGRKNSKMSDESSKNRLVRSFRSLWKLNKWVKILPSLERTIIKCKLSSKEWGWQLLKKRQTSSFKESIFLKSKTNLMQSKRLWRCFDLTMLFETKISLNRYSHYRHLWLNINAQSSLQQKCLQLLNWWKKLFTNTTPEHSNHHQTLFLISQNDSQQMNSLNLSKHLEHINPLTFNLTWWRKKRI